MIKQDFKFLVHLVMGYVSSPLIKRTDIKWNVQLEKIKKKNKLKKQQEFDRLTNLGVGVALGLGMLGAIMAVKSSLF